MRFHILDQIPMSVKLNPQTGEIIDNLLNDVMAQPYKGETRNVQCALCGLSGGETLFVKAAQRS
ncbi:MAG: hypothetical protein WCC10_13140 [Tumebacillaceae bacterium]